MSRAAVALGAGLLALVACGGALASGPAKPADPASVPGAQVSFERTRPATPHLLVTFADTPSSATARARLAGLGTIAAGRARGGHLVGRAARRRPRARRARSPATA